MVYEKVCGHLRRCLSFAQWCTSAFPDTSIRLCQFHVIQALTRWQCEQGYSQSAPSGISLDLKYKIAYAFRHMQRCRDIKSWPGYRDRFLAEAKQYVMDEPEAEFEAQTKAQTEAQTEVQTETKPETKTSRPSNRRRARGPPVEDAAELSRAAKERRWEFIEAYFRKNWFVDDWIR